MNLCYIALGSNLENPQQQLQQAIELIKPLGQVLQVSSFYASKAVGSPSNQPDYINAVLCLKTSLASLALLDALQNIENQQGRIRTVRFGARTLDLDILLFNQEHIQQTRLEVPHPRMLVRPFVIVPLHEIAPALHMPSGEPITHYYQALDHSTLEKLT